jgi:hypothetical protein
VILAVAAFCALSATSSAVRAADGPVNDEVVRHFKAGVAILQDPEGPRFEEAYAEFKRAYELSHSPKVLGNLGLCAMKLERDGEAIAAYTRYLKEVDDIDPEERAQVTRDLQVLTTSAATVRLSTRAPAATIVDTRLPVSGASVTNFYEATPPVTVLTLRPGRHALVLRIDGKDRARWEHNAAPGESISHELVVNDEPLAPPPPPPPPPGKSGGVRAGPVVLIAVGAAALVAGGALGVVTLDKVHALESQCLGNVCPAAAYPANVNAVRPFVQATDYTLLGGGVVALTGAVWWLAAGLRGSPAPAKTGRAGLLPALDARCTSHGCFAALGGGF